jgi:hypothetical protein
MTWLITIPPKEGGRLEPPTANLRHANIKAPAAAARKAHPTLTEIGQGRHGVCSTPPAKLFGAA